MADQQGVYDLPPGARVRVYHLPPDHISNRIPNMTPEEFGAYKNTPYTEAELDEFHARLKEIEEEWDARARRREEEEEKELESKKRKQKKSSKKKSKKKHKTDNK